MNALNMNSLIIDKFLWILSHTPTLSLSDDDLFADLKWERILEKKVHYRFSIFNIMLGDIIVYLLTYDFNKKRFKFIYTLELEKIDRFSLLDEKANELELKYREHVSSLRVEDKEVEKESLRYHIQNEEKRIDVSMNKLNIYTTIFLAMPTLLLAIIDVDDLFKLPYFNIVGVLFICYFLINIFAYIFQGIKVGEINKSKFSDLKSNDKKANELLVQYYYDWQQLKYKADLHVLFIKNLQGWIIAFLILTISIIIVNKIPKIEKNENISNLAINR